MQLAEQPFSIDDILEAGSLAVALDRFLLCPRIEGLRQLAKQAADDCTSRPWEYGPVWFDGHAGIMASVPGYPEKMLALQCFVKETLSDGQSALVGNDTRIGRLELSVQRPAPPEIEIFNREFERCARLIFDPLCRGSVRAFCHRENDQLYQPISAAIWRKERHYVLPSTGDVFEIVGSETVRRYTAIELRHPDDAAENSVAAVAAAESALRVAVPEIAVEAQRASCDEQSPPSGIVGLYVNAINQRRLADLRPKEIQAALSDMAALQEGASDVLEAQRKAISRALPWAHRAKWQCSKGVTTPHSLNK